MHLKTSETKTDYYFFKDLERIIFMALGAVEMMRFLYDICRKLITKGGISDTKIGLKSGNTFTDFLHYTGNFKRCFSVYSNRCMLYSDQSVGQSFQTMLESHTVSAFPLMGKYSCSTELMF